MAAGVVVGAGAVGARAARQLLADAADGLVVVDSDRSRASEVAVSLGPPAVVGEGEPATWPDAGVAVLATPADHRRLARAALERGLHVVSVADAVAEVRGLLDLDAEARARGLSVVVGAGFGPGLSCLLARHAAAGFDAVDEVHVARTGSGGPSCARQQHRALGADELDWHDGAWIRRRAGSGRQLCWFPEPLGARDCYRAGLADPLLVVPAFPRVARVTARLAGTRRDRLTARLPMLRRPSPEGLLGAVRVEVRGRRGAGREVRVLGALDRPAAAAGTVAGLAASWAAAGRLARPGAGGLAEMVDETVSFLQQLARRGVRAAAFEGGRPSGPPPAA